LESLKKTNYKQTSDVWSGEFLLYGTENTVGSTSLH